MPVADSLCEPAAEDRSEQSPADLACEEHAESPAGAVRGSLLGHERNDGGLKAAHGPLYEPEAAELPDILREPHAEHDDGKRESCTQNHGLSAVAVGKAAPDRRKNRETDKVAAEYDAGPAGDISRVCHTELGYIKGQHRRHLAHADGDDKAGCAANP